MAFSKKNQEAKIDFNRLPQHIGIIMDGNGRWAKKRGLIRTAGHSAGARTFKEIARYCNKIGIKYLTVYAFSTENWSRPKAEVDTIMGILKDYLKDAENFREENIKANFIGDLTPFSDEMRALMKRAEEGSKDATGTTVNIAINYGGRDEIVHSVKKIAQLCANGEFSPEDITEKTVSDYIYTFNQPDADLIIRPSGEYRLSNFLLWQSAYSEFWFSDVLWPDFKPADLDRAIISFQQRNRRYGGIDTKEEKK